MATSGTISKTFNTGYTLKIAWSVGSQSVSGNTSSLTATVTLTASGSYHISSSASKTISLTINGTTYTGTCTVGISGGSTITLMTKTVSIPHNSDGTKTVSISTTLGIQVTLSGTYVSSVTASGSATLPTIPRASSFSVSNGTLGTAQTITITPASSGFTHTLTYTCGSVSATICTQSAETSVSFTPPLNLAAQNTTGTTVQITIKCQTYSGSTALGSASKTITCSIPSSVAPSCVLTVQDEMGYKDTYGWLKGLSKVSYIVNPTKAQGSAITAYSVAIGSEKFNTASGTSTVLSTSGNVIITATVTDARGRTGSTSATIAVVDYAAPQIGALHVIRCNSEGVEDQQGNYVKVTYSGTITSLGGKNTAKYVLKYKRSVATEYMSQTLSTAYIVNALSTIIEASSDYAFDIAIEATDAFQTTSRSTSVSTGYAIMHWRKSGKGIAFGKVSESDDFDVNMTTIFRDKVTMPGFQGTLQAIYDLFWPVGSIYETANGDFDPAVQWGGTWERITDKFLLAAGNTYTAGSTGGETEHELTESENGPHTHVEFLVNNAGTDKWTPPVGSCVLSNTACTYQSRGGVTESYTGWFTQISQSSSGKGTPHNNMPPYLAVYIWKRTG